ncbi:MAG: hypothetical protein AAFP90_23990, partial [Planctomycetota bacterium]
GRTSFQLRDDVDNVVRMIDYGFSCSVVGRKTSADDLPPGESKTTKIVFQLPLPKTQSLVATVDLQFIGRRGKVEFEFSPNDIRRLSTN